MGKLKELLKEWCDIGIHLPYAHDAASDKPSITLLFAYLSGVMVIVSLIILHIKPTLVIPTAMTMLFWALAVVFYRLRKLDKVKFDLDDKSIELEGSEKEEK